MATSRISRSFSQIANDIEHAKDEYEYFKTNETFSNEYVDVFINKTLENEIIPDLLISVLSEMNNEYDSDDRLLPSDLYVKNTIGNYAQPMRLGFDGNELVSDSLLHNFIRLPTDNKKKLSPYVVTPMQRYESVLVRNRSPEDVAFVSDSPKLKEYTVADPRRLSKNSLKPISNSGRNSMEFNSRERSNLSFNSKPEANSSVLNSLTEEFINKSLRHELIPRLALDTIESASRDRRTRYSSLFPEEYDPKTAKDLVDTTKIKIQDLKKNNQDLFSTEFLHDFEFKSKFNGRTRNANFQFNKSRINDRFVLAPIDTRFDNDKNKTNNLEDLFSTDFLGSFDTKSTSNRLRKF